MNENLHDLLGHVCAKPIDLTFLQWYNEYNKTSERLEAQGKPKDEDKDLSYLNCFGSSIGAMKMEKSAKR